LFTAALLILWEAAVFLLRIDPWILPAPSAIASEFWRILPRLGPEVAATGGIALEGLAAGAGVGLLAAFVLHLSPAVKRMIYPLLVLSQNIPMIALAPLLVIWFGFGDGPKILVVALVCFFPVTVATLDGFRQADPVLRTWFHMSGASRLQLLFKLEWPSALPSFFSGLKLAATYSVMGAVIAEWLGAKNGLGVMMQLASSSFRTDRVFVAIGLIVAMSLVLFAAIAAAEKMTVRWNKPRGGDGA
jgi:ABC-type nitrate/sulfonate/bicarbonate transport system permease component